MSISTINYKGLEILQADYSVCTSVEEQISLINELADVVRKNPPDSTYILVDVTGRPGTKAFMSEAKKLGKEVFAERVKARAILGINPLKKMLVAAYNSYTRRNKFIPVDSREEGLEYLYRVSKIT